MLYVFVDNEAVIKMTIEAGVQQRDTCQEPTEILLIGCLTESIWTPRFKYGTLTPNTESQTLIEGHFTRDERNNLLCLCNFSHFKSLCCARNFSLISCTERMAKRMQEQSEENIVAKSRPTAMNLTSYVAASSSALNSPIASRGPGTPKAPSRQVGFIRKACCGKRKSTFQLPRSVEFLRNCSSAQ